MYQPTVDLAGEVCFRPTFWQTKARINYLIDRYLNTEQLSDRLADLPQQFRDPQPRPWSAINWQQIAPEQVIGLDLEIFLSILRGALDTEAPIRSYTQASRQYLQPIHPQMAKLVGGVVAADGNMIELGLWEKEERKHTPALGKLYQHLSGVKIIAQAKTAKTYQPGANSYQDLYQHGLHRIATEYGAVCLYLWLMAHTTETTQQVLQEILKDEINHLVKFWGMGMWLYPNCQELLIRYFISQINTILPVSYGTKPKSKSNLSSTFSQMMLVLNWQSWSTLAKGELVYTFIWILKHMWSWSSQLTPEYLQSCCGCPNFLGNNNLASDLSKTTIC